MVYNGKGTLSQLDMNSADMDAELTSVFMRIVPIVESGLATAFKKDTTIVQEDFKVSFDDFWNAYNHKINKKRCIPLWDRMTKNQQVKAFYSIRDYDKFLKNNKRMKCDPENYLRNEMWENEYKF